MGTAAYERDARRARAAYLGAVLELSRAMVAFEAVGMPLEPKPGVRVVPTWTSQHASAMERCAQAWSAVVQRRPEYDGAVRALGDPAARR